MDLAHEKHWRSRGYKKIAGIDEAGRGALAGPVVAAAVILPRKLAQIPEGIRDSKQLTRERRLELFHAIRETAPHYGIGMADRMEVDQINVLQASLLAMKRAVAELAKKPDLLLIDGKHGISSKIKQNCLTGGDRRCLSIAAASILAKVTRDHIMAELDLDFPIFGFGRHMGYGTREHRTALGVFGPCLEHRNTFRGVSQWSVSQR